MEVRKRKQPSPAKSSAKGRSPTKAKTNAASKGFRWYHVPLVLLSLLAAAIWVVHFIVQGPIRPVPFSLPAPPRLEGVLKPNDKLQKATRWLLDEISGPESIVALKDGSVLTGTSDGRLLQIRDGQIVKQLRLGEDCLMDCDLDAEPTSGRPLGMRLDVNDELYVVDTYLGIYHVDMTDGSVFDGKYRRVLKAGRVVDGKPLMFINDIQPIKNGEVLLFTDSSTRWQRRQFPYVIFESSGDGRLLRYDIKTDTIKVLLDGLHFANGLQVSKDESFVLVSETTRARILKYHLTGKRAGQPETFASNLPGLPDNIRVNPRGNYWVGLAAARAEGRFNYDFFGDKPGLRGFLAKVIPWRQLLAYNKLLPAYGIVVELDANGQIVRSLQDPTGKHVSTVSEVEERNGKLYLGSFNAPFLGVLNIKDI